MPKIPSERARLLAHSESRRRDSALTKAAKERDGWTCVCCGLPGDEAHHVHPFAEGGEDSLSNLVTLCPTCHFSAPADPDAFLAYQKAGGCRHGIWAQVTAQERAAMYFTLPFAKGLADLASIGGWRVQREEWTRRLDPKAPPAPVFVKPAPAKPAPAPAPAESDPAPTPAPAKPAPAPAPERSPGPIKDLKLRSSLREIAINALRDEDDAGAMRVLSALL